MLLALWERAQSLPKQPLAAPLLLLLPAMEFQGGLHL
jgi:hypothetical protein